MRRIILISILLALLLFTVAAYSVSMSIEQVAQLGGTGEVSVSCPATPCSITSVKWVISATSEGQFRVSAARITWTPTSSSGSYTVYVALYSDGSVISSGSATQPGSSSSVTTTVTLSPNANPRDVTKVEIIIVQD